MTMPSKPALLTLLLLITLAKHQSHAQPILTQPTTLTDATAEDQPLHGPNDRFTEGTMIESFFNEIDLNGDGRLDKGEVEIYFQRRGAPVQDGLWEREDKNGDGFIDRDEFARKQGGDEL